MKNTRNNLTDVVNKVSASKEPIDTAKEPPKTVKTVNGSEVQLKSPDPETRKQ